MLFRKIFSWAALVVVGAGAVSARAQGVGIYGTVTGERLSGITCLDSRGCASTNGSIRPYGAVFGAFYDWRKMGPATVGFDLRGQVLNDNKSAAQYVSSTDFNRHYAALGGVRASFRTPLHAVRPYAQVSAGYARTNAEGVTGSVPLQPYQNYGEAEGLVGLDVSILPMLDFRAIELGAGELFGSTNHSIQSIGMGVVLRFGR